MILAIPGGNQYSSPLAASLAGMSPLARLRPRPTWTRNRRYTSSADQESYLGWILPDSWLSNVAVRNQSWPQSGWETGTVTAAGSGGTCLSFRPSQRVPPRKSHPDLTIRVYSMFWNFTWLFNNLRSIKSSYYILTHFKHGFFPPQGMWQYMNVFSRPPCLARVPTQYLSSDRFTVLLSFPVIP